MDPAAAFLAINWLAVLAALTLMGAILGAFN